MNGQESNHQINIDGSQEMSRLLNDYIRQKEIS
jgi:hypothetical protein